VCNVEIDFFLTHSGAYPRMNIFNTLAAPGRVTNQDRMDAQPEQRQATPDRSARVSTLDFGFIIEC
jgi:hypothetical protein